VGDDEGVAEAARDLDVIHKPEVVRNAYGTPKIDSIFALGREAASGEMLAYINTDVMLLPDFMDTAMRLAEQEKQFLIIGQRWDLDVRQELDFSDGGLTTSEDNKTRSRPFHAAKRLFPFPPAGFLHTFHRLHRPGGL
jgi:hypothetical protein